MISHFSTDWSVANQRYLLAAIRIMQTDVEQHLAIGSGNDARVKEFRIAWQTAREEAHEAVSGLSVPTALDTLAEVLGLSAFERNVLLLCAVLDLDTEAGRWLTALIPGQAGAVWPTFGLALAALPDAHWSALAPNAPLRHWRLIEVMTGPSLTQSPLRIDEQILHYLTGLYQMDERLRDIATPLPTEPGELAPSQRALANRMLAVFAERPAPVIGLDGPEEADTLAIAAWVGAQMGTYLYRISAQVLPTTAPEIDSLLRLWNREAALHTYALCLDCTDLDPTDRARTQAVTTFIDGVQGSVFVIGETWRARRRRTTVTFTVQKPTADEQFSLWQQMLNEYPYQSEDLLPLVAQFNLSADTIRMVGAEVMRRQPANDALTDDENPDALTQLLWRSCCAHTRPRLDGLARRVEPVATWADIVLPDQQTQTLREVVMQVSQRNRVYGDWGFGATGSRGLGISVLFAGESGTGKTMAAEVLANALHLDLYRIDLSQVVNKYIGETEKNLSRIFDAAESGGAILLFDEADALFGKRSDVKDSHDRYSNIEVSYLLQRMEAYRGLAILTTNMRTSLDKAFLRRLRFVVPFPYPDATHRADIWRRVFPPGTPKADLDFDRLARLNVPGGNIRNIALNAAFMAAHDRQPVQMAHIALAARSEYSKLDRPLSQAEINGW